MNPFCLSFSLICALSLVSIILKKILDNIEAIVMGHQFLASPKFLPTLGIKVVLFMVKCLGNMFPATRML
uniref:Putative secreted protein n=1 Tax=Xenopsylla cheopis TaxID=163159 RepID=A0A6M2DWC3_XENCH